MDDDLAQRLLAAVMNWDVPRFDAERPYLKILAGVKYDYYEQFRPGMRFIESLALWLKQFATDDRPHAYDFIKRRLIYISQREMHHLVVSSYPYHINPALIEIAAKIKGCSRFSTTGIAASAEFAELKRRCLFVGLSDGARLDAFRRGNARNVSNEQVVPSYQFADDKAASLRKKLCEDLKHRYPDGKAPDTFKVLVLVDDFNGSGYSLIHREGTGFDGKLPRVVNAVLDRSHHLHQMCDSTGLHIVVVHYVSVESAKFESEAFVGQLNLPSWITVSFHVVQLIPDSLKIDDSRDQHMMRLIKSDQHYDIKASDDPHLKKGGTDNARLGYAKSALPVVFGHNAPNNSIFLMWANPDDYTGVRGLFPRVIRHRGQ